MPEGIGYETEPDEVFLDEELGGVEEDDLLERVQSVVQKGLRRAIDHYEEHLEPIQEEATNYYHGDPFGDEEEGRSQVVSTDVRDVTLAQLPSLLRIFMGSERPVEFRPRGPEDEEQADQATDYIRYIIMEDNPGFLNFYSWFHDALVRKLGIVKWWWEESYRQESASYTGLTEQSLLVLQNDPLTEDFSVDAQYEYEGVPLFDATVVRREVFGCPKFEAIPNEEFVFTPNSRKLDEAPLVAHVREVPQDYLIDTLGLDPEVVREAAGKRREASSDSLEDAREYHRGGDRYVNEEDDRDESQRPVVYAEAYCLVDGDGDGIAELRLFQCIGEDFEIVNGGGLGEVVDELPFAVLTPYPEPHTIVGLSNYDLAKDIQRIKSQVLRGTLNSLAAAIEPQQEVVEGMVNMGDLLNPDITKVVRVRAPGQIREIRHEFVGPATLPVLAYFDELKENRTGVTKAAAGLDADSLQSATKAAVAATLSGSQQRVEMIARIFAETGVKQLFKGLLRLVTRNQNQARLVRLRGKYVEVDPRHWDATMDVTVNVALGGGTTEERIGVLTATLAKQEEYMMNGVPFVNFQNIRYTLGKLLEAAGYASGDKFFQPWGPEQQAQFEQAQAQAPPKVDPAEQLVEIERQKAAAERELGLLKLELERMKIQLEDDRDRDKMAREIALKKAEIEAKYAIQIEDMKLKAQIEADRLASARQEMPA